MKNTSSDTLPVREISDAVKSWVMVLLILGFVLLYGLALIGKLKPLSDVSMVSRLEPIIFVIIGYYFGRLPSQQNEKTLREEIGRQTQKADAAQHAKEQALQIREALEAKLKTVSAMLSTVASQPLSEAESSVDGMNNGTGLRRLISVAQRIVNS